MSNRYHACQAGPLFKMAKSTSDPEVAAKLIDVAANLKDQAGELPPALSADQPDASTQGPSQISD